MLRFTLLSALCVAFLSSSALAWDFTNHNGYNVVLCEDGTMFGCSAGGQQFDCPDNPESLAAFEEGCADHGGLVGVVNENSATAAPESLEDLSQEEESGSNDEATPVRQR